MPDEINEHGPGFRPADAPPGAHRWSRPGTRFREAQGLVDVVTDQPKPEPPKPKSRKK